MDRKPIQGPAVGVIAGAVLVVAGTLMTWITASGGFVNVTIAGAVIMMLSGLRLLQARKALGEAKPGFGDDLKRFAQEDEDVRA